MYAAERQQAMAQVVRERGRMSVTDLAREYDVTTETVRRDLTSLERTGNWSGGCTVVRCPRTP